MKRTVAKVPKFISLFTLNEISIKRTWTPTMYLKWSFLSLPTCNKRTLVIKFYHSTCQTPEMQKIVTYKFFDFHIKKRELMNLFD